MLRELRSHLPVDKYDTENAERLVALGFPAVGPVLSEILQWTQDNNWPVAGVFAPFLACIGVPLAPHIKPILRQNDEGWKYSVLVAIVANSTPLARELQSELLRLASEPSDGERGEGLDSISEELLGRLSQAEA